MKKRGISGRHKQSLAKLIAERAQKEKANKKSKIGASAFILQAELIRQEKKRLEEEAQAKLAFEIEQAKRLKSITQTSTSTILPILPNGSIKAFNNNLFNGNRSIISYQGQVINIKFTDQQALNICNKMSSAFARQVAKNFSHPSSKAAKNESLYQLHYLANKALYKYGGPVLTFILGLEPLKFRNLSAYSLKAISYPKNSIEEDEADFPTLTFTTNGLEAYTMVFHILDSIQLSKLSIIKVSSSVSVFSKSTKTNIGIVDTEGHFFQKLNSTNASVSLFCEFIQNSESFEFSSGVETGFCFVCGRPLSTERSLRYGIGPVCLERMGS
jgi:hypothetical protein